MQKTREDMNRALKDSDAFWSNPDIILGMNGVSDYLNIGKEEIIKRWKSIPFHKAKRVSHSSKKGKFTSNKLVFVYRSEMEKWADETQFWKFKETTVKNYKEPLKAVPTKVGFGYYGAITTTKDGDGIQCHLCGKFFMHLSGHINIAHKMNTKEYKEKFDIAYSTPLTSDNHREVLKLKELERIKKMTPEEREEFRNSRREWIRNNAHLTGHGLKGRLETRNKRGTCPDQLVEKIRDCSKALGKTPSKREFIVWTNTQRYVHKIYETFGSWKKALEIAGFETTSTPTMFVKGGSPARAWAEEELVEYLRVFYEQTGKSPTATDWYSHYLPDYKAYINHFGSIKAAREEAEIPHPLTSRKGKSYITTPGDFL